MKLLRKLIKIEEETCNGCGRCATACHEGAIGMVNGKARLLREDFCDGLGDCLPACPTGAITFEEREAPAYDEAAVKAAKSPRGDGGCACPGTRATAIRREGSAGAVRGAVPSQLGQWPCQIKLVPPHAPYFDGAQLLLAADCTAFAYGNFHAELMRGRITLIGCPKLDAVDYAERLTEIIRDNDIKSVTIARMEVPCCGGLEQAARRALQQSGKFIPWRVVTVTTDGKRFDT